MLSRAADALPTGDGWQFEPKWDGFRTIVFRDGDEVLLQSRDEKPMNRYFPELVAPLAAALPGRCVVDGTPAYDADILVGDVITAVDGVSVSSSRALGDLLRERREKLSLSIFRRGQRLEKTDLAGDQAHLARAAAAPSAAEDDARPRLEDRGQHALLALTRDGIADRAQRDRVHSCPRQTASRPVPGRSRCHAVPAAARATRRRGLPPG